MVFNENRWVAFRAATGEFRAATAEFRAATAEFRAATGEFLRQKSKNSLRNSMVFNKNHEFLKECDVFV